MLLMAVFAACSSLPKDGFVLRGTIPGAPDSTKVSLAPMNKLHARVAEGYVVNGKFELQGNVACPTCCFLSFSGPEDHFLARGVDVFVENGEMTFETPHADSLPMPPNYLMNDIRQEKNYKMTGSASQDVYYAFQQATADLRYRLKQESGAMYSSHDAKYARIYHADEAKLQEMARQVIREGKNLYVSLYLTELLKRPAFNYDQSYLDELAGYFASSQDTCAPLREFRAYLEKAAQYPCGRKLEDMELSTPDGKKVRLFDLLNEGEYLVLDFWASYCGPCRAGIPHLEKMKETYKDIQFIDIGTDSEMEPWLEALQEEKLSESQYFGGMALRKNKESLYNFIEFIPAYLVVNPEREVVFYSDNSASLEAFIEDEIKAGN